MSKALRLLYMLQSIPRADKKENVSHRISAKQLHEKLAEKNLSVDIRSVQRDLHELSTILPDLKNDCDKYSLGWYWEKNSKIQQIPAIDTIMALTFKLVDKLLSELVPKSVKNSLQPYFDSSDDVLKNIGTEQLANWPDKVRILPRVQPLKPAAVDEEILSTIYQGVFEGKQIKATYKRTEDSEIKDYQFNPLGLIFRESVIYLVASFKQYSDTVHFALHRFIECELTEEPCFVPDGFSLDKLIQSGSFEYADVENKLIKLTAIFSADEAFYLSETPLSDDQAMTNKRDGRVQITATVKDTRQLRWWLLSFGDQVEVVKPKKLRDEFVEITKNLSSIYS
ncbi:MAG: WYL domain-containing protein [Gammaproteobacteria bacterium]|nr:WYL domain-containing protein [Gammaproteobacteria bacterium]